MIGILTLTRLLEAYRGICRSLVGLFQLIGFLTVSKFEYSINTILYVCICKRKLAKGLPSLRFQRGVYPAEDFTAIKKYGLNMLGTCLYISSLVTSAHVADSHLGRSSQGLH